MHKEKIGIEMIGQSVLFRTMKRMEDVILKKKVLSLILAGMMAFTMTACKGSQDGAAVAATQGADAGMAVAEQTKENGTEEGFAYPMEEITFTINGTADGGTDYYNDSEHPQWAKDIYIQKVMRDKTGVSLVDVGGGSNATTMSERFLLMLAGGELPDIMVAPWTAYTGGTSAAIAEGYIVDLMDYREFMPNMMKYLDENPEIAAQVLTTDGKLGFAPFIKANPVTGMGMVIRKDWLDEVGMSEPETIDELHDVLVAFRDKYQCKAPLTFESRWLFLQGAANPISSAWLTTYQEYILNGQVQFGPLTKEFKEFIQTLSAWYREGLLDPDFASVDKTTVQAKFSNGEAGVSLQQINNIQNCISANEGTEYAVAALPSMVLNKGDEPQLAWQSIQKYDGGFGYAVSTTCSDIEAACRYLDWRFSEEGMYTMNYGIEGVTYEVEDGKVRFTDLVMNNEETPSATNARDEISWNQNRAGISLDIALAYIEEAKQWIDIWDAHMEDYILPTIPYTAEEQERISGKWGDIDSYCQEMILKFVIGSEDLANWDSFVESVKKMGIEDILAAKQEAYDAYLAKVESLK